MASSDSNLLNLLARQPFPSVKTFYKNNLLTVVVIILHPPFSVLATKRKDLFFENDKDETSCVASGGNKMYISREIPLVR